MVMLLFYFVSDLIGYIFLFQLYKLDIGFCSLFLKLENQNFGGLIKDWVVLLMINEVECQGKLVFGGMIIEVIVGNIGFGLVLIVVQKNYCLILVVLDKMSCEKIFYLWVLGVMVLFICFDVNKGYLVYYQDYVCCFVDEMLGVFYIDQFNNDVNLLVYVIFIVLEFYQQLEGDIDVIVVGVGFGGMLGGFQVWFVEYLLKMEFIFVDLVGLIFVDQVDIGCYGEMGFWLVEGIGEDFILLLVRLEGVYIVYCVSDCEVFYIVCQLLQVEGVLVGFFIGILFSVVLCYCWV